MESTPQEEAEGQAIVQVLAVVLERLVSANSHLAAGQQEETKFHALRAPAIGILQYLERIHKYSSCSKECFILALIYIDRLIQRNNFLLTSLNVHRVVITAVLLAAKFFDDAYYNNAYYAKVGGVLVSEMNTLECEFLFKIDFSLRVVPQVFDKYREELLSHSSVVGLEKIEECPAEELLRRVCNRQQQLREAASAIQAQHHQFDCVTQPAPTPQAPLLGTYSQAELDPPVVYPNPTPAACYPDVSAAASHYPIQAIQQSMIDMVSSQQAQVSQAQLCQQLATAPLDPVFPFPNLAQQVSVQQQAQAPVKNPTELDLVSYQTVTNTTTPVLPMTGAPQDVASLSQYSSQTSLAQDVSLSQYAATLASQQAPAYSQAELMSAMYGSNLTTHAAASTAQAPAYTQQTNYYANGRTAQAATARPNTLQQGHPEITPSPPLQPPIQVRHGVQQLPAGCHVDLTGDPGAEAAVEAYIKSQIAAQAQHAAHHLPQHSHAQQPYATQGDAGLDLHRALQPHTQLLPSHPIAILGNQHHHLGQDNNANNGWPCNMFALERPGQKSPA